MEMSRTLSQAKLSRREFIKGTTGFLTMAAFGCRSDTLDSFLQKNLRVMTKPELKETLARLERQYRAKYNIKMKVYSTPPKENTLFGYGLDLSKCIGCRRCVYACVRENNQSRGSGDRRHNMPIHWIKVLEMDKSRGIDFLEANPYYDHDKVPRKGYFYMPIQCQQCKNPPCVKVCPVKATWSELDGIVVVDYNWCIGCRYCMIACPYGARRFNWTEPYLPHDQINTNTHVLGNRPRYQGTVEKCTFCIQRVRLGRYPACVEICPVGARKFGNILDPASEIRYLMEKKRVFVLKEELNTAPKFYYFYGT